ncbi:MAG: bifunctional (p)ppGpp synthetase/guanosine-3',5'-bis(diphosphate) 3'-pyrophosphohydrolase [Alphaproteobacteria bacterium]|nr:bifunctional (p)ppGpp synthetase/guanosine-3',5'-bis(diphosphate) 3'-pyrophosphohydrolase [Alphaproteobacteria bacterium]
MVRIEIRPEELAYRIKDYNPSFDDTHLNKAYVFGLTAHGKQTRASGESYFNHPVEVAGILTKMKLDEATIITGLLHDVVEDSDTSLDEIERKFGSVIRQLVDGVTKLSQVEMSVSGDVSNTTKQVENLRKFILAMSKDIRVLLVKLADRLHNMRTLSGLKNPDKRKRIAIETLDLYAPLAGRIGLNDFKDELEDLAFAELQPEANQFISSKLSELQILEQDLIAAISEELTKGLQSQSLKATVQGRMKSPFSIWKKMQRKNVSFENLSDIMAFRILVDSLADCYQALGVVHTAYSTVPGRFKDYISTPKSNGYQSIHTCVIGPHKHRIEVQIRTREMQEVADRGVAAHWSYKEGVPNKDHLNLLWLRDLQEVSDSSADPEDFLEHAKLSLYSDQVFCFTPRGEVYSLPAKATAIDFAYAVHSEIGYHCVGAKINGIIAPLRTVLRNGDQVEILTSPSQVPQIEWGSFAVTGKVKSSVKRARAQAEREEHIYRGLHALQKEFLAENYPFSEKPLEQARRNFAAKSIEDLYIMISENKITARDLFHSIFPGTRLVAQKSKKPNGAADGEQGTVSVLTRAVNSSSLPIQGLPAAMAYHLAGCCHPLPGDRIVGIVSPGKGATIHTIGCPSLASLCEHSERWLDLSWNLEVTAANNHLGRITAVIAHQPEAMGNLCTVIGMNHATINNLKITHKWPDHYEIMLDIEVRDLRHLTHIITALRANPAVNSVERRAVIA